MLSVTDIRARKAAILKQVHTIKLAHHPELSSELPDFQRQLRSILRSIEEDAAASKQAEKQAVQEMAATAAAGDRSAA